MNHTANLVFTRLAAITLFFTGCTPQIINDPVAILRQASLLDGPGCVYVRMTVNIFDVATGARMGWGNRTFERQCWRGAAAEEHARANAVIGTASALATAYPDKYK